MSDEDPKRVWLEKAIQDSAADLLGDGEMLVSWVVVAATRSYHGGGAVVAIPSDEAMPQWEARGLLATALRSVDQQEDDDQ